MACGCKGQQSLGGMVGAKRVAVYEVMVGGETVLSTEKPSAARQEARRRGGSIRVTSRPAELDAPSESKQLEAAPA